MPTQKLFKRRVRERMSRTGERYTAALRHVAKARERTTAADRNVDQDLDQLATARELASDAKLTEATGQDWAAWIAILDRWGARDRTHREIARYLATEQSVPPWWTQAVTTGYERARGMRRKHQQPVGFTIYASKTVAVPLDVFFAAFVDDGIRVQWLTDGSMRVRTSQPGKLARFDWGDGATRILVTFEAKGPMKSTAHVVHERLADAEAAEIAKGQWKARVTTLKAFLESDR